MRFRFSTAVLSAAFALTLLPGIPPAAGEPPGEPPAERKPTVALFDGLGGYSRPVETTNPLAQKYFDQGLNFMFAFNHDEAIRAFREAAALDPGCAMAHWGIALSSGVNINDPRRPPEKAQAAWDALQKARAGTGAASPANRALIEALGRRYADPLPEDPAELEQAYAAAMQDVWERFPEDADVGALYAESMMNLRPWELWSADGTPAPETPAILAALEAVLTLNPNHPLAAHLYVHAVEASPDPGRADAAADSLRGAQPALGHLLHMPSHIDIRRGRWGGAIEANALAIKADRAYQQAVPGQGYYRLYMAHNFHMLAFAAMMRGQSELALATIRDMFTDVPAEWAADPDNAAIADGFVAMPLEVLKHFGRWDEILAEPQPPESYPIARAMWRYARGVAFAAKGQVADARTEQVAFREAVTQAPEEAVFGNNKAADLFAVADPMLEGEILFREGKRKESLAALRKAVEREDALRYSEPPDWFVPVRHALGAVLLRDGQATAAEAVYREDLRRWPDNGWSLHGLADSLDAQGKKAEAAAVRAEFRKVWEHADVTIPASCYCVCDE